MTPLVINHFNSVIYALVYSICISNQPGEQILAFLFKKCSMDTPECEITF